MAGIASEIDDAYRQFLRKKVKIAEQAGFDCDLSEVNGACKGHQGACIQWNVLGGRRAVFAAFGLGKTIISLETARIILQKIIAAASGTTGRAPRALIVCPLGVKQEFGRDATHILGWASAPRFVRTTAEADATPSVHGVYLTNYESIREGKIDPAEFDAVLLDEAQILRGFGGSKTFRELMLQCTGDGGPTGRFRDKRVNYRFVATATPAPNEYIELLAYAEFLGIMDISQAKTRFFKRDSTKADNLTLQPGREREFWLWVASWALFIQKPSDLGYSDEGYTLPPMTVHWHEVPSDHTDAGKTRSGQYKMFRNAAIGVQDAAAEKRISLPARVAKLMELRAIAPDEHRIIWHDLEAERHAIQAAIPSAVSVWGNQDLDERERRIIGFSDGEFQELSTKPVIAGCGCNFQRHCAWEIFTGIGFKFTPFIQGIHRVYRFMQDRPVRIDIIYTEAERDVRTQLEIKWRQHNEMVAKMTEIIKEFGLSHAAMAAALGRKMGVERVEIVGPARSSGQLTVDNGQRTAKSGEAAGAGSSLSTVNSQLSTAPAYRLVNDDSVLETRRMATNSVHLVATSIPFATQYEYSPNYADFGHSEGNDEFFKQMDFLTPELLRVLAPGRVAAIHVKDRIVPGGMTKLGFQTVYPFHCRCIEHYQRHGFAYMGMITVVTDVVRENNQTYRLGWTRQCQDATCMGVGMPEYVLLFRKPTSDPSNSYADVPPTKSKAEYSRSRWQIDAHAFWRSTGNRSLTSDELRELPHREIFRLYRRYSLETIYDFEHHVRLCEGIEKDGRLPTTFMLLQPQSWSPDVWSDVTRMMTLNGRQHAKGKEMHLCPLQFDIVDRLITRFTMPGETVYDPFGGLMTVPYRAIKLNRVGVGCELNPAYFLDGASYCRAAVAEMAMPSLFDAMDDGQLTVDSEEEARLTTEGTEDTKGREELDEHQFNHEMYNQPVPDAAADPDAAGPGDQAGPGDGDDLRPVESAQPGHDAPSTSSADGSDSQAFREDAARDSLFEAAVQLVREKRRCNVYLFQRAFNIGYRRAARLVDQVNAAGIVKPAQEVEA